MIPGMTVEDAFKVLFYLTDFIGKESDFCTYKNVAALDKVIDLERLGFD